MVGKELELIKNCINERRNFVLNGGAGSGKTSALVDTISLFNAINPDSNVACITYTNVAAEEVTARVGENLKNFKASTIHDFLWFFLKSYQKNLKEMLVRLIASNDIKYSGDENLDVDWYKDKTIEYREWKKLENGIISHDEVLKLANGLFKEYPLLHKILADKFDAVFIDEYQDTDKQVIEIFLDIIQQSGSKPIIGLFGDSMQAIYDKGIGDLKAYIQNGSVYEVQKSDNWRCSKSVINLINNIRDDGLIQNPAGENIDGKAVFIYSNTDDIDFNLIKKHYVFDGFVFDKFDESKELYLTHKLIANQSGFGGLIASYKYKESLTGDKPDLLIKHLFKIEEIIELYNCGNYNEFLRRTDFVIRRNSDLRDLKKNIERLKNFGDKTIEEIIGFADELNIVIIDDRLDHFIAVNADLYNTVKNLPYSEISNLFKYRSDHTPYLTQHGVKGAEFDNVFVVLDNGRWNNYNFKYLFENQKDKESIVNRTRKIFYVSCSRARHNLVVFFPQPTLLVLENAKKWFGVDSVIEL